MATPAAFSTLRETDLGIKSGPVDGTILQEVFRKFFAQINPNLDATNKCLSKGLTPGDNFRCETISVKATHAVPLNVKLQTLTRANSCIVTGFDTALPYPVAGVQMLQPSQTGGVTMAQVTVWFNQTTATGNVRLWLFEDGLQMTTAPVFSPLMLATASIAPVAVAGATCSDQTFAVAALLTTDRLSEITPPSALGNVSVQGYCATNGNLLLHFTNPTAGNVTPPAGIYSFAAFR